MLNSSSDLRAEGEGLSAYGFSHTGRQPKTRLTRAGQDSLVVPAIYKKNKARFAGLFFSIQNIYLPPLRLEIKVLKNPGAYGRLSERKYFAVPKVIIFSSRDILG